MCYYATYRYHLLDNNGHGPRCTLRKSFFFKESEHSFAQLKTRVISVEISERFSHPKKMGRRTFLHEI